MFFRMISHGWTIRQLSLFLCRFHYRKNLSQSEKLGHISKDHFLELAREINIAPKLANRFIEEICEKITDKSILSACENETSEMIYQGVIARVNQLVC